MKRIAAAVAAVLVLALPACGGGGPSAAACKAAFDQLASKYVAEYPHISTRTPPEPSECKGLPARTLTRIANEEAARVERLVMAKYGL